MGWMSLVFPLLNMLVKEVHVKGVCHMTNIADYAGIMGPIQKKAMWDRVITGSGIDPKE